MAVLTNAHAVLVIANGRISYNNWEKKEEETHAKEKVIQQCKREREKDEARGNCVKNKITTKRVKFGRCTMHCVCERCMASERIQQHWKFRSTPSSRYSDSFRQFHQNEKRVYLFSLMPTVRHSPSLIFLLHFNNNVHIRTKHTIIRFFFHPNGTCNFWIQFQRIKNVIVWISDWIVEHNSRVQNMTTTMTANVINILSLWFEDWVRITRVFFWSLRFFRCVYSNFVGLNVKIQSQERLTSRLNLEINVSIHTIQRAFNY